MSNIQHLSNSSDLITPPEEIRSGFVALALERNRQATPFVEQARAFKVFASQAKTPIDLLKIDEIRPALLTAAGFSDKALGYTDEVNQTRAIEQLIENFLEPAGTEFVEELVYRFLLTRGDSLGGVMRNIAGKLAERKLTRAIISALTLTETAYQWLNAVSNTWIEGKNGEADIELSLKALSWKRDGEIRTLIYNRTIPLVKKNIDMCLLHCAPDEIKPATYRIPEKFIAFGELKGGIDPAGADEHWKTAQTALTRIRTAFASKNLSPTLFFIGAVIVDSMAQEIWRHLEEGTLKNAANLTNADQIASLSNWLVSL
ncbi:restriction endonuclease [Candidatus Poribacteria bacterium]|nr:MAG: restriction endonuclease [Candidatus Poribacteria bacterium]